MTKASELREMSDEQIGVHAQGIGRELVPAADQGSDRAARRSQRVAQAAADDRPRQDDPEQRVAARRQAQPRVEAEARQAGRAISAKSANRERKRSPISQDQVMPKRVEIGVVTTRQDDQDPPRGDCRGRSAMPSTARSCTARRSATSTTKNNESHSATRSRSSSRGRARRPSDGSWCGRHQEPAGRSGGDAGGGQH